MKTRNAIRPGWLIVALIAVGASLYPQNQTPPNPPPSAGPVINGLMWTGKDNGSDVTWNEANSYCQNLRLGGYSDWRLPSIDELSAVYDPSKSDTFDYGFRPRTYHIKGGIKLSGWPWSGTRQDSGSAWDFFFSDGQRHSLPLDTPIHSRALCVRRSGE